MSACAVAFRVGGRYLFGVPCILCGVVVFEGDQVVEFEWVASVDCLSAYVAGGGELLGVLVA